MPFHLQRISFGQKEAPGMRRFALPTKSTKDRKFAPATERIVNMFLPYR